MDGAQVAALAFLLVLGALFVHEFVSRKKEDRWNAERWRAQKRLESLDDVRTLEVLWDEMDLNDAKNRAAYETRLQEWYGQNPWALGLRLEEAAWVLRQSREHEDPSRWREEIESNRDTEDNVAMFIDSADRTRIAEGRPTLQDWEEQMGWGEKHRVTPEEVAALEQQHGVLRTRDVMETLRQRFAAGDDAAWVEQVGPMLRQRDVAALMGVAASDVPDNGRLLGVPRDSGETVFPAFQFTDDGRVVEGVAEVIEILRPVVRTSRFIVGWLTSLEPRLASGAPAGQLRQHAVPINRLREGEVEPVLEAARQTSDGLDR